MNLIGLVPAFCNRAAAITKHKNHVAQICLIGKALSEADTQIGLTSWNAPDNSVLSEVFWLTNGLALTPCLILHKALAELTPFRFLAPILTSEND